MLQIKMKVIQVAFSWILVNYIGVIRKMVNQICVNDQVEVKTMEK